MENPQTVNLTREEVQIRFSKALCELLAKSGITQDKLAKESGVSKSTISRYCANGWTERTPDIYQAGRLADYFEVSLDYLTGRSGCPSTDTDIIELAKRTGLSAEAIEALIKLYKEWQGYTPADYLLQDERFLCQVANSMEQLLELRSMENTLLSEEYAKKHQDGKLARAAMFLDHLREEEKRIRFNLFLSASEVADSFLSANSARNCTIDEADARINEWFSSNH